MSQDSQPEHNVPRKTVTHGVPGEEHPQGGAPAVALCPVHPSCPILCSGHLVGSRAVLHLEPKHPLSGSCGSLTTLGAQATLSLLMFKWTGSCFHPTGSPGGWAEPWVWSWTPASTLDSIELLPVVTLGLPRCPPRASVPISLQEEDWAHSKFSSTLCEP